MRDAGDLRVYRCRISKPQGPVRVRNPPNRPHLKRPASSGLCAAFSTSLQGHVPPIRAKGAQSFETDTAVVEWEGTKIKQPVVCKEVSSPSVRNDHV